MKSDRKGYIYILHFERPLSHAQHYVGCTTEPRERLITHAQGRGARIVRAALAEGIEFALGALGVTHMRGMRRIERQLKDWHGAAEHCSHCQEHAGKMPRCIPGTTMYPIEEIPWPTHSMPLSRLCRQHPEIVFKFTSGAETLEFCDQVKRLMNTEKEALGFIPAGADSGIAQNIVAGRMAVCHVDGVLAGYVTFTETEEIVRIHQCIVRDSQRRCGIGRRLVEMVLDRRPGVKCVCKVRDDLMANAFWPSAGFAPNGFVVHETSGHRLNVYVNPNGSQEQESAA